MVIRVTLKSCMKNIDVHANERGKSMQGELTNTTMKQNLIKTIMNYINNWRETMSKAIVIFGTTTGSTETAAGVVVEALMSKGVNVLMKNVSDASPDEVGEYDLSVLGASTWGEGEIQDDFVAFYDEMNGDSLKGKNVAVFGCGDSDMFPHCFCEAVDKIRDKAVECGANHIGIALKIDGDVNAASGDIKEWAQALTI